MTIVKYTVEGKNPCFDQISLFVVQAATQLGCVNLKMVLSQLVKNKGNLTSDYQKTLKLCTGFIKMQSEQSEGYTKILNTVDWLKFVALINSNPPTQVIFETNFESSEKTPNEISIGKLNNVRPLIRQRLFNAIGGAYESCKEKIISTLGSNPTSWPVELQFFRHARNASFHNNVFDIRDYNRKSPIDVIAPPKWRNLVIPDKSVNGMCFAGPFFQYHLLIPFLTEIGEIVENL